MTTDDRIKCVVQIVSAMIGSPNFCPDNNSNVAKAACFILHEIEEEVAKTPTADSSESWKDS